MYFSNLLNDQVRKAQKGNTAAYKCKRKIARYGRKENKELGLQINSCSFSLWYLVRNLDITSIFPYLRWYRSTHVKWCSAGAYEIGCPFRHHPWFTGNRRRDLSIERLIALPIAPLPLQINVFFSVSIVSVNLFLYAQLRYLGRIMEEYRHLFS